MLAREILVASAVVLQEKTPDKEDMRNILLSLLELADMDNAAWKCHMAIDVAEELREFFKLFTSRVDFAALQAANPLGMRDTHPYGELYRQFVDLHHECFVRYCAIVLERAISAGADIDTVSLEPLPPVARLKCIYSRMLRGRE